jgi:hypothetical protein
MFEKEMLWQEMLGGMGKRGRRKRGGGDATLREDRDVRLLYRLF